MIQGQRLRQMREQRGLSKAAFGRLIGKDGQYVWKVETGVHPGVTSTTLTRMALALDISADYLLGISDCATVPDPSGTGPPARRQRATAPAPQDQAGAPSTRAHTRPRNGHATTTVQPGQDVHPVGAESAVAVASASQPEAPVRPRLCPYCAIPMKPLADRPGLACPACRYNL